MSWTNFFDKIYVINLPKRTDRLLEITEEMVKYGIEFDLIDGIQHEKGAEGLRLTVENLLVDAIENGYKNILIFEDDCMFIEPKEVVDDTMNRVVNELPENYHICYLSAQPTNGFHYRHSSSLLQLDSAFATHSWALSLQGMKEIISTGLYAPIDNCLVATIQTQQRCYITFPILTTQRPGISDIGGTFIDWNVFLVGRYNQKLAEMKK